jgi:hypothetical protein
MDHYGATELLIAVTKGSEKVTTKALVVIRKGVEG